MAGRSSRHVRCALATIFVACGCERAPDKPPASTPAPTASARGPIPAPPPSALPSALPSAASPTPQAESAEDAALPARDPRLPGKRSDRSASDALKSRDGTLFIAGQDRPARHTHGGAPAHIGNVTFVVTNDSTRVRRLSAERADFLRDHGCEAPASSVVAHPKLDGLVFENDDDDRGSTLTLEIPAKSSRAVRVNFASVEAYYSWCDRFAIRVFFSVDGREKLAVTSELAVMRMDPLPE